VTDFTVVRRRNGLLLLLRVRAAESGPERRLLPAPTWSRLGAKQTPLEVARMTRLTHNDQTGDPPGWSISANGDIGGDIAEVGYFIGGTPPKGTL
jgi:hypothetical protein